MAKFRVLREGTLFFDDAIPIEQLSDDEIDTLLAECLQACALRDHAEAFNVFEFLKGN